MYHRWLRRGSLTPVRSLTQDSRVPKNTATICPHTIGSWEKKRLIPLLFRTITSNARHLQGGKGDRRGHFMGIDPELGLLFTAKDTQDGGDHELKTSPLATWDVIDSGAVDFAQRGLLGEVLSVHADDLSKHTKDSRLYMNLDAPSSGLVCGVQGSGKSYTVSCIMESALMNDPRVGSLPAPLATVVFHYDQEISNRPCEAAFLSESKDGTMRGVEEVVVLVSPKNQEQRKEVYSHLKHVQVEPLKLAEGDLNAKRMLSMMGWDDQETMPLYLQSALAILRDMGSNFTYGGFLHQLRQRIFNMSQSSMLQMRLGLLDSFLHGGGQDISSYFGPGKLLIIDLSDRFVDGKTASMLFDICLGLFMEWKAPTGKLIVLDEAHKYLTPFTSNQLTSTISGIIRQQRHLSTRVIISTQEPTVVPAPVLDLLSWIICHRFSSPSWVKHLDRHVCVDERNARNKWEDHVMTLKTGEAVLFSPGSLFLSKGGATSTLSTGYAIIKSRPRVTKDGGMSIMATDEKDTGVGASKGVPLRAESPSPFAKQTEPESTILALQASSTTSPLAVADFSILKAVLNELRLKTSYEFHPYLVVHQAVVAKRPGMFFKEMRWKTYIQCAESHQIVQVIENGEDKYLTLALPYRSVLTPVSGASNTESFKLSLQTPKGNTNSPEVHKEFEILISLMNRLSSADVPHVGQSTIGAELAKSSSTGVRGLGYKNVKNFLTAAQEAGIVQLDSKVVNQEHFWRLSISFMHVFTHS